MLPAQPVDATPSNALIRQCFPGRSDLFGCTWSRPSQGSVPADLTLASDLTFVFNASRVRPKRCVDLLRPPRNTDGGLLSSAPRDGRSRRKVNCLRRGREKLQRRAKLCMHIGYFGRRVLRRVCGGCAVTAGWRWWSCKRHRSRCRTAPGSRPSRTCACPSCWDQRAAPSWCSP